jgi:hypothetical protein
VDERSPEEIALNNNLCDIAALKLDKQKGKHFQGLN